MYNAYIEYIKEINKDDDLSSVSFKSAKEFTYVLEHTSPKQGIEYLKLIESGFPEITYDAIRKYINLNDKYGNATKSIFTTKNNKLLYCSSSNMRYIYHALTILRAFKLSGCKKIVELGAGYGGLCLAISMFQSIFDVEIEKYNMVDLPDVGNLIENYLELTKEGMNFDYDVYDGTTFGSTIEDTDMFFISNYCFSELEEPIRNQYIQTLLPKTIHGFMVFQTCFGMSLQQFESQFGKSVLLREEERPQTAPEHAPNWFIFF